MASDSMQIAPIGPTQSAGDAVPQSGHPQSFIFARELSEVYLLLDHISGRADKNLPQPNATAGSTDFIAEICKVGWPPQGGAAERAVQASILLRAKNELNAAAYPANGATIAFTIMVAGGEREIAAHPVLDGRGWDEPPTRMSLAVLAYPGLMAAAGRFRRAIGWLVLAMFVWLLFTCGLSWNIAAGHAVLSRIDALAVERVAIVAKIDAGDLEDSKAMPPVKGAPYCDRHRSTDAAKNADAAKDADAAKNYESVAALRLCHPLDENTLGFRVAYANLADWLTAWSFVKLVPHWICGKPCLATGTSEQALTPNGTDAQWASILNEVLASAVLPICYGILGAAAAIVRGLLRKMRDSLLTPRELALSLGQLALGAVIGACIGLFVAPSGATSAATQAAPALTGSVSLSASALSFIAGFGVESVFVALEGFIKRVFNVTEPAPSK